MIGDVEIDIKGGDMRGRNVMMVICGVEGVKFASVKCLRRKGYPLNLKGLHDFKTFATRSREAYTELRKYSYLIPHP